MCVDCILHNQHANIDRKRPQCVIVIRCDDFNEMSTVRQRLIADVEGVAPAKSQIIILIVRLCCD